MLIEISSIKQKTSWIILVAAILLIFLSGCTSVLKILYGVKKPKVESEKSILKYAAKKGLLLDNMYAFSEEDWIWAIKNISFAKAIPDIMVFNKDGNLLKYREESQCNAKAFSFISSLTKEIMFNYEYDPSLKMNDLTSKLKDLKGNAVSFPVNDSTDFYVFIFWARWLGRLNKDHVKVWEKEALQNKNCSIKVFKINMDQQAWWKKNSSLNEKKSK